MAQPTGPQRGAALAAPPPLVRAAAGRDMSRPTSGLPHFGHFTLLSSERRMTSSSKLRSQRRQAYS